LFGRVRDIKTTVIDAAGSVKEAASDAADAVFEYVDPLAKDEKLRQRLAAAIAAGAAARESARRQAGLRGLALRLGSDPVLRTQLAEMVVQLQKAQKRAQKTRSHKLRNTMLFVAGVGMVIVAAPAVREAIVSRVRRGKQQWATSGFPDFAAPKPTSIDEEIEVAVPVSAAYNQWTQFEEFPKFMEGVDEVRQLDDTLLHWAATIGGKHAEWDAKIVEQEPDRRITWESTDGKQTRGTVMFEEMGAGRSRIRLHMTYTAQGAAEKVGSAIGLDNRRIRGDLQRFRDLIEGRQVETGAWRGEIRGGRKTGSSENSESGSTSN
jgi:uncharacterized membrane protein